MRRTRFMNTPVGRLGLVATDEAVVRIFFAEAEVGPEPERPECAEEDSEQPESSAEGRPATRTVSTPAEALLSEAERQIGEYFAGTRRTFDFRIAPEGTAFQRAVWEALRRIPYGRTRTYRQIAEAIGHPAACRAVGMANHRNPIVVVIPCHRVVGADGSLTGYAGGLEVKARLLGLESGREARQPLKSQP